MQVKELREILSKVDGELELLGCWEGISCPINCIYEDKNSLCLDVDSYYNKGFYDKYKDEIKILYEIDADELEYD